MKIRTQLTLLFTLITGTILVLFATIIYFSAKENREREFYALLKREGLTKGNLFFDAHVDTKTLQDIYRSNREILNEVEVAIYNKDFNLLYHDAVEIDFVKESKQMIDEIFEVSEIKFYQDQWQVFGFTYDYDGKKYAIIAAAYDLSGYNKLNSLMKSIIWVLIVSMLFVFLAGLYFSKKAFDPVKDMITKADQISASNLHLRLQSKESQDELSLLAHTFNNMLARLENSFDAQKHFVSNISHELRTPLSAIITELELALHQNQSIEDYISTINRALMDSKRLVRLSNSLLDMAKASYDPKEISFRKIRVDELLLDARHEVQKTNPNYHIDIDFENDFENENNITLNANEYLLKVAFINLFENGCKFSSDHRCTAHIYFPQTNTKMPNTSEKNSDFIQISFSDKGIGILENDIENIFTPFYRGENKNFTDGNGIGLFLTRKIILLHQGMISVASKKNEGTTFFVKIPHL